MRNDVEILCLILSLDRYFSPSFTYFDSFHIRFSHFFCVCLECVFIYEYWSDSELIVHCKKEDYEYFGKEHNLAVFNHIYEIDWLIAWVLCNRFRGLGFARGFVKNSIKFIPIWGWFFGLAGHIFLRRSFEKDKELIEDKISEYMNCTENTWIVLMAEGTRFTKEKYENCLKFAKEKGIVPLKHHLIPRSKGFGTCVPLLKKYNCPAVYNVQVSFDKRADNPPTLASLFLGKKITAHVYIDRIPMEKVEPTFDFLYDMFKTKDALQDSVDKHGNFYEGRGLPVEKGFNEAPRTCLIVNAFFWIALEALFIIFLAYRMIIAGKLQLLAVITISVISVCKYKLILALNDKLLFLNSFLSRSLCHAETHAAFIETRKQFALRKVTLRAQKLEKYSATSTFLL